jgi:hypothetical protein
MTDSQRKAMEQANDVWIDLRMAGVNSSEANILPHVERIAAALEAAFAEGKRQSNGATQEQLRQARAEEREQIAHWLRGLGRLAERVEPDGLKRFWYADVAGEVIQGVHVGALASEAPAARDGGERG